MYLGVHPWTMWTALYVYSRTLYFSFCIPLGASATIKIGVTCSLLGVQLTRWVQVFCTSLSLLSPWQSSCVISVTECLQHMLWFQYGMIF